MATVPKKPAVPKVDPRTAYVNKYVTNNMQSKKNYLADQGKITQGRAGLEYDNKINNIQTDSNAATQRFDLQLNQMTPKYDNLRQQANQNAYSQQNKVNQVLARSGMMNTGAAVGNTQMVNNNLNNNLNDISLQQQQQTDSITLEKNLALQKYSDQITQLKADRDKFISTGNLEAAQQYQRMIEQARQQATDLYYKDEGIKEDKRQFNLNYDLQKKQFDFQKRQAALATIARRRSSGGGSGGSGGLSLSEALRIKGAQDNNIKELQQRILNAGGDVNTIKKIINTYPLSPEAKTQLYTQFVGTDITNQQIFQRNPLMDQIYKKASQAPNKKVASAIGKNKKNPLFY